MARLVVQKPATSLLKTPPEKRLETHDIAIPLPQTRPQDENELFRIILLSATDVSPPEKALDRMERLYHQTGGRHVGIMFLIRETHSQGDGTRGFMSLQARYNFKFLLVDISY